MSFGEEALQHMQEHGVDAVFCMTGSSDRDGTGAMELFACHTKFAKADVDEVVADGLKSGGRCGGTCSKDCLKESALWLLDSVDESVKSTLRMSQSHKLTGPQLWMLVAAEAQSKSGQEMPKVGEELPEADCSSVQGREHQGACWHSVCDLGAAGER